MVIAVLLDMVSPRIIGHIVDDVIVAKQIEKLAPLLWGIVGVGVGRCIFQYTKEFCCDWAGSRMGSDIRINLFGKIQGLSANFFDGINSGELMERVRDDVDHIWDMGSYVLILLAQVVLHSTVILAFMFSMNWKLSILPTVAMVIGAVIALKMEKVLDDNWGNIAQENSEMNNTAQENLSAVRIVKSFVREDYEIEKFRKHNTRYRDLRFNQSKLFVRFYPLIQAITHILPCIVFVQGGILAIQDEISVGELTAFIQYSMNIMWPMEMLGWLTQEVASGKASIGRLNKIYAEIPAITQKEDAVTKPVEGNITFEHVDFKTDKDLDILKDISFDIAKGQTLGIMGATGAGKTSIINLLTRTYDATGGRILLDGIPITDYDLGVLRRSISCVMQDVFLFSDTIDANVKLGQKNSLEDDQVAKAMEKSCAAEFVSKMEEKHNTVIGERGIGLSGGQKQRITIARAFVRNAPVLVLDDSTSALDSETEQEIQKTLAGMEGMTKIIIGHRISAVRRADKIIVLEKGSIAECGTHEELLAKGGLYAETYKTQYPERG
ncbi:MAG: ABC transporter ATP-binding protein/permease [Treponemataceae bacterium]|nr:ABC transporter ATP-binding protein/permease [Treponemataceae bacterium]